MAFGSSMGSSGGGWVFLPFLFLLLSPSLQQPLSGPLPLPPSVPVPPITACDATPYPVFCRSMLPNTGSANLYDYGRFSLSRSLADATRFSSLINRQLARAQALKLTTQAIRALEDCRFLADLNVDFLFTTGQALASTGATPLLDPQADWAQTLLSALLTNQQTCLDGLQVTSGAWSVRDGLIAPLSNGTKFYSVSLALFSRAWVPDGKRRKRASSFRGFSFARIPKVKKQHKRGRGMMEGEDAPGFGRQDGGLPLRIPKAAHQLFESRSGRKLMQSDSGAVTVSDVVVVSQDGSGNFTTITDAITSAPNNTLASDGYYLIYVSAGLYEEYVSIPKNKKYVMMVGDGINQTVITGNRSVVDGWTTFNSATFVVVGQGFVATNITIRNTAGPAKHQAVALRNGADLSSFYSCSFEGYQDTLYTHSLRQFYRECDIYGTVDYIFGNAAVVFQGCNMYARQPMQGQSNLVTAQGRTDPNQNTGTSIQNCRIMAADDLAAAGGPAFAKTYLGRPWKQYSRTVVMQSFVDGLVDPSGWLPWDGTFALDTLYYAEYNNTGSGADTSNRVTWPGLHFINATDAANFTVSTFLLGDNWLPQTGVPYTSGML